MMKKNILNKTQKQALIYAGILILIIVLIIVLIFSSNRNSNNVNTQISSSITTLFTTSTIGVEPWNTKDKKSLFPYFSDQFNIYYFESENRMEVYSENFNSVELERKIINWVEEFNFMSYDEFIWEYFGKETQNEPLHVTPELEKLQLENL